MGHIKFDFALLLVLLTGFTGFIYGMDRLLFAKARAARKGPNAPEPMLVEYCRSFFPVILFVLLIRSFIAEPFRIPTGSMMPTLLIGDFILVNKFSYGIRLPVLNKTLIETGSPKRGDVVVFKFPGAPNDPKTGTDYIKRVIGVPGDQIDFRDNTIYVNGEAVSQELLASFNHDRPRPDQKGWDVKLEHLPGRDHQILQRPGPAYAPWLTNHWQIPPGQYFVMGDNRDNSEDSRFWGMVPESNLVGRAFFIWFSWDFEYGGGDFTRVGTVIRGGE